MQNHSTNDFDATYWDPGHPYRFRTWFRVHAPGLLSDLFPKGSDCESVGGRHRWYNQGNDRSGCYHCHVVSDGQRWDLPSEVMGGQA